MNEGERRAGNGIRKGKLKRRENWGRGRRHTGTRLNRNSDVIDAPDLEETMKLDRTPLL